MDRLNGHAEYEWIGSALLPLQSSETPDWVGHTVGHVIPLVFHRYVKLLHPIYEDLSIADKKLTWDDVERAERPAKRRNMTDEERRIDEILNSSGRVVRQRTLVGSFIGSRVYWRQLAERWGKVYHPGITDRGMVPPFTSWPRYLVGPEEGNLDVDQLRILAKALAPLTGDQACFFWWMMVFREEPMYRGHLVELPDAPAAQLDLRSPNYVWPLDRTWCICTDYDLCFTVIGGTDEVTSALMAETELEVLEIDSNTRVDYRADDRNTFA
jgi:hypothetical protein